MRLETKFQDKDFELGEVVRAEVTIYHDENKVVVMADRASGGFSRFEYNSIKDFTDHWEDAPEEPKEYWIPMSDEPYPFVGNDWEKEGLATGLISLSKKENEIKREKLKAWERLKDKGFEFDGHDDRDRGQLGDIVIYAEMPTFEYDDDSTRDDLDLLFPQEGD